jgi:hypothetical protein
VAPVVPPLERLRHMSAATWEDVVLKWVHSLKQKYACVEKHAGSGDMGLDVIAFESATADDPWVNYLFFAVRERPERVFVFREAGGGCSTLLRLERSSDRPKRSVARCTMPSSC